MPCHLPIFGEVLTRVFSQCGEVGHIARNCPKGGSSFGGGGYGGGYGGGGFNQNKTCYSCGGVGHMSRKSPPPPFFLVCLREPRTAVTDL